MGIMELNGKMARYEKALFNSTTGAKLQEVVQHLVQLTKSSTDGVLHMIAEQRRDYTEDFQGIAKRLTNVMTRVQSLNGILLFGYGALLLTKHGGIPVLFTLMVIGLGVTFLHHSQKDVEKIVEISNVKHELIEFIEQIFFPLEIYRAERAECENRMGPTYLGFKNSDITIFVKFKVMYLGLLPFHLFLNHRGAILGWLPWWMDWIA